MSIYLRYLCVVAANKFRPVGELLDTLLKDESEVLGEGDGLSMGLSPSMMLFFRMPGPFIGVCLCVCVLVSVCVSV